MSIKVAVCTGVKGAGPLLREYVEYYISLGVDKMFLYDNNEIDGEDPSETLKGLEDHIEIIDIRGDHSKDRQWRCYTDCYMKHHTEFDFICFFDDDEFLFLNKDNNIKEYLSRPMFQTVDCIGVNWKMYSDNDLLYPIPNKTTFEQFTAPVHLDHPAYPSFFVNLKQNDHIKTIIHCTGKYIIFHHPHFPISTTPLVTVNASGKPMKPSHPFSPYDFEYAELRHYQFRSTSEFCYKRLGTRSKEMFDGIPYVPKKEIDYYFSFNTYTPEKMHYIQAYCKDHGIRL